ELKAQIQEKDTMILKLKKKIKSLRADDKERKEESKSVEVADLNESLQEKVLVITALKEQLKGKAVLSKVVSLNPINPPLLQVDVVPLVPKLRDENPSRTLGDYFRPSHEGYRNTIKLPERNMVCCHRQRDTNNTDEHRRLLHEKFYNFLGSAPNRCSVVWARLGVVYPVYLRNRLERLDHGLTEF
nr:hypothetical protein [Tanacetum cinerariifolium]